MALVRQYTANDGKLHLNGPVQITRIDGSTYDSNASVQNHVPADGELVLLQNMDMGDYGLTDLLIGDGYNSIKALLEKDNLFYKNNDSFSASDMRKGGILQRLTTLEQMVYMLANSSGLTGGNVSGS